MPSDDVAQGILWLLRHLGPQAVSDLTASLGKPAATITSALQGLSRDRRAESFRSPRGVQWRIIPSTR